MATAPFVTHDTNSGVFSVDLDVGEVDRTVEFDDSHLVDLASDGRVLSIEVLTPEDPKVEEMAEAFGFQDRVEEILAAIAEAFGPTRTAVSHSFVTVSGSARVTGGNIGRTSSVEHVHPLESTVP